MKFYIRGLFIGSFLSVQISWCTYFLGLRQLNIGLLLVLFFSACYITQRLQASIKPHWMWALISFCFINPLIIYYAEWLIIHRTTSIFLATLLGGCFTGAIIEHQISGYSSYWISGLLIGLASILLPLPFTVMGYYLVLIALCLSPEIFFKKYVSFKVASIILSGMLAYWSYHIEVFDSQVMLPEKIIGAIETPSDHLVITRHKGVVDFYLNARPILSTSEYHKESESKFASLFAFIHTSHPRILVIGGESTTAWSKMINENSQVHIDHFALSPAIYELMVNKLSEENDLPSHLPATKQRTIANLNSVLNKEAIKYDVIIVDPLPNTHLGVSDLYELQFLKKLRNMLTVHGGLFISGFDADLYPLTNQVVRNNLNALHLNYKEFQLPLNTSGVKKWFVASSNNPDYRVANIRNTASLEWLHEGAISWFTKSGQSKKPNHDLIHTTDHQYLQQQMKMDSINSLLNF